MSYSEMTVAQLEDEYASNKTNIFYLECNDTIGQGVAEALGKLYTAQVFISKELERRKA